MRKFLGSHGCRIAYYVLALVGSGLFASAVTVPQSAATKIAGQIGLAMLLVCAITICAWVYELTFCEEASPASA